MTEHGGDLERIAEELSVKTEELTDFSSSINPSGFPPWLREEISRNLRTLLRYPDIHQKRFTDSAAAYHGTDSGTIFAANGASEIIDLIPRVLDPDRVIIPVPSFGEYERSCRDYSVEFLYMKEENGFSLDIPELETMLSQHRGLRTAVFIGNPNNPTATLTGNDKLRLLAEKHPEATFCLDESFIDFLPGRSFPADNLPSNMIIIRSMTKFYGIPGLRLGYCIASKDTVLKMKAHAVPWSVNSLALAAGERALSDDDFRKHTVLETGKLGKEFRKMLEGFSWLKVFPSDVNFILLKIKAENVTAGDLSRYMTEKRVIIRTCGSFRGLDKQFFRLAVRKRKENFRLIALLREFEERYTGNAGKRYSAGIITRRKKTPAVMIQGTASNAGKSIITAGLCRILHQDGIKAAPFKAQNMSLNSAVTPDGLEIGRAQALQAAAAGIKPDVRMNPLLLKPTGKRGSDIILSGLHAGFITAENWFEIKNKARKVIEESYDSLSSEYDAVILEGAGSPAEINLKKGDIVNMAMAAYAEASVLITGDIDRGGVYASFIGTMEVFEERERDLVKGFIVNRFRGSSGLLKEAHDSIMYRTGKPVIGIVPYIDSLNLPDEDSVSFKEKLNPGTPGNPDRINIGVFDLPSISNFTDIDPLMNDRRVNLTVIRKTEDTMTDYDIIIIPGSKNVAGDLEFLRKKGFADYILKTAERGVTEIIGICGGFQMLGRRILDPGGVESDNPETKGLNLINMDTIFREKKQLKNVRTVHIPSGIGVGGYEIHHGTSILNSGKITMGGGNNILGAESDSGRVWGTYLHGIFENDTFRDWIINGIMSEKGIDTDTDIPGSYSIDTELDRLAGIMRESIDVDYIKKLLGLK